MKIETITALEISKKLPMKVKSMADRGMFQGTTINFHTVDHKHNLIGSVVGNPGRTICVLDPDARYIEIKNEHV